MVPKIIAAPHTPRQNLKKVAHLERPFKMMRASFDAGIFAAQKADLAPRDSIAQSSSAMSLTVLHQFLSSNQIVAKIFFIILRLQSSIFFFFLVANIN